MKPKTTNKSAEKIANAAKKAKANRTKALKSLKPKKVHVPTTSMGIRMPRWLRKQLKSEAKLQGIKFNKLCVAKLAVGMVPPPVKEKKTAMTPADVTKAANWTSNG